MVDVSNDGDVADVLVSFGSVGLSHWCCMIRTTVDYQKRIPVRFSGSLHASKFHFRSKIGYAVQSENRRFTYCVVDSRIHDDCGRGVPLS